MHGFFLLENTSCRIYMYIITYINRKRCKISKHLYFLASDFSLTSTTAVGVAAVAAPPPAVGAVAVAGGASGASNFKFVALDQAGCCLPRMFTQTKKRLRRWKNILLQKKKDH